MGADIEGHCHVLSDWTRGSDCNWIYCTLETRNYN
jgi:hypothetical protein